MPMMRYKPEQVVCLTLRTLRHAGRVSQFRTGHGQRLNPFQMVSAPCILGSRDLSKSL